MAQKTQAIFGCIEALLANARMDMSVSEIAAAMGERPSTVKYCAEWLEREGAIESYQKNGKVLYRAGGKAICGKT